MERVQGAPLPMFEMMTYFLIWTGGVSYSTYCVYLASNSLGKQMGVRELGPGWDVVGRRKDTSDFEWEIWLPFIWELTPWFLLHHAVAELLRWWSAKMLLRLWYFSITSLFIILSFGLASFVAMVLAPLILFSISQIKKPLLCWASSILMLIFSSLFIIVQLDLSEKQHVIMYVAFAWVQLRCLSFCLDWIYDKPWVMVHNGSVQVLCFLSYSFYFPLMFFGPFVPFEEFEKSINAHSTTWENFKYRIFWLFLNSCRFLGWMIITEFCLHFIYCNAIQQHHEILPYFDAWTLNGLAYCIGQFFLNKYVVVYGLTGTLAEFDSISAPPVPRCIAHISTYSDMWRHFDRGFYNFLRRDKLSMVLMVFVQFFSRYIYDPLLEKYSDTTHHLLLTVAVFAYVYLWHGLSSNILIWSVCNFLGVLLETLGHRVTTLNAYQRFETKLSMQNIRRWRALVTSPLFIMSALTMFFFLGGMEVGTVFVLQIIHGSLFKNLILLFFAYSMCQVSLEIKLIKARKLKKQLRTE